MLLPGARPRPGRLLWLTDASPSGVCSPTTNLYTTYWRAGLRPNAAFGSARLSVALHQHALNCIRNSLQHASNIPEQRLHIVRQRRMTTEQVRAEHQRRQWIVDLVR